MRSEKILRLGRLSIDGDLIAFEPEHELAFQADRRDALSIGILYHFRESTEWKEHTRLRITAHLEGRGPRSTEAEIRDNPVLDDTQRGFVSAAIRTPHPGQHKGRFRVEASHASGPWGEAEPEAQLHEQVEGDFILHVH